MLEMHSRRPYMFKKELGRFALDFPIAVDAIMPLPKEPMRI